MFRLDVHARKGLLALAASAACVLPGLPAYAADAAASAPAVKPPAKSAPKAPAKAADDKPREGTLGKGTSTGAVLTREQLRQCMAEQDRLKREGDELLQTQLSMGKTRAEIDRLGAEIDTEKATVDRSSQAAVEAYNERLRTRAKMIDDYQAAAPPFNTRVDKLAADRQAYTRDCGDRRYFEDDYDAIKAGQ